MTVESAHEQLDRFLRTERRVDDLADRTGKLEGSFEYLATKEGLSNLKTDVMVEIEKTKTEIEKSSKRIIIWVAGFILTSFGIQVAVLLNILSRLPT